MDRKNKFVKGALILSVAGIIAKIISAFYRIPLAYILGTTGLGYYNTVYPIYTLLVAASIIGIPNTVSKLIAEDVVNNQYKKAHQTFKMSLYLMLANSVIAVAVLYMFLFSANRNSENTYFYIISGIVLAPIFYSVIGAIRGYFLGLGIVKPSAIAQLIENSIKAIVGITLVLYLKNLGYPIYVVVAGATLGVTAGSFVAALFMAYEYKKHKNEIKPLLLEDHENNQVNIWEFIKKMIGLAIPVTIVVAAYSVMTGIDSLTISNILVNMGYPPGYGEKMIIGQMSYTYSIINVPLTISVAISASLVPAIAYSNAANRKKEVINKINQGLKFAFILALPAATGLFVLAQPVLRLIFSTPADYEGYMFMQYFSICLIMMILSQTMAGVLQGVTKHYLPLISLVVATIFKLILNIVLLKQGLLGHGVAIASLVFYFVFMSMNYYFIRRTINYRFDFKGLLFKPLMASIVMGGVVYGSMMVLPNRKMYTLVSIILGAMVYGIMLLITKGIKRDDLAFIGDDHKIIILLKKVKLI